MIIAFSLRSHHVVTTTTLSLSNCSCHHVSNVSISPMSWHFCVLHQSSHSFKSFQYLKGTSKKIQRKEYTWKYPPTCSNEKHQQLVEVACSILFNNSIGHIRTLTNSVCPVPAVSSKFSCLFLWVIRADRRFVAHARIAQDHLEATGR